MEHTRTIPLDLIYLEVVEANKSSYCFRSKWENGSVSTTVSNHNSLYRGVSGLSPDLPKSNGSIGGMSLHKREDPWFELSEHFWHRAVCLCQYLVFLDVTGAFTADPTWTKRIGF